MIKTQKKKIDAWINDQYIHPVERSHTFDDVLTYRIQNVEELYGIYIAGWDYLHDQLQNKTAPWIDGDVKDGAIEKTINDLVEKSIRNFELVEKWSNAPPNQN